MKKSIKFGGSKRFYEGGVARSSDGELIRFGYEDDDEYQKRVNADKAAQGRTKDIPMNTTRAAMEEAIDLTEARTGSGDLRQRLRPPAPLPSPSKTELQPSKTYSEYDVEEPGSAGFSRTPLKQKPKPKPAKKKFAKGGSVGSASKRADGIAMRGKTRGKMM